MVGLLFVFDYHCLGFGVVRSLECRNFEIKEMSEPWLMVSVGLESLGS